MLEEIFISLERSGYIQNGCLNREAIYNAKVINLVSSACMIDSLISKNAKILKNVKSPFSFSSSAALSGGKGACSEENCRKRRVHQLAQYAALYSDHVYIRSYFDRCLIDLPHKDGEDTYKYNFANDLALIVDLKPLIIEGIVIPYSIPDDICPHCFVTGGLSGDSKFRADAEYKRIKDRYLNELQVNISYNDGKYKLVKKANKELLHHGSLTATYDYTPTWFKIFPKLGKRVRGGEVVKLSRTNITDLGINRDFANEIFEDIGFSLMSSQSLGASVLTDNDLHVELLNSILNDERHIKNNYLSKPHISAIVPIANDLNIEDILNLRKRELDSFITFRSCLNKAVSEYRNTNGIITIDDARDIYGSYIEPELSKLNKRVAQAKRHLIKSTQRELIGWTGAISFGVYLGLLKADIMTIASAMGLATIAVALKKIMEKSDTEETIRSEDFYFLWKIRKLKR